MSTRVNHHKATPALTNALSALSMEVAKTSIDPALKHLIDIRAVSYTHL
ncbi:carboxymuconolactone decarboxylase family protein, partial [Klebsiella pneumoniae]